MAHDHPHHHAHEQYAARPHPEFVVLDIGEELGALIIHTDPSLHGVEIEISATGRDQERSHKEVLERRMGVHPAFTAVFDAIPSGSYSLWVENRARARDIRVQGGQIVELDWRSAA